MTKEQAIKELKRCADICPITPLAEACRIAIESMTDNGDRPPHDCINCRHKNRMPGIYPCSVCKSGRTEPPSMWEPKEM